VKHAEHIAESACARGIPAAAVHGEMPAEDRARALDDFKVGALRAITSMDVLTTGYDEPAIDAIALLRPTKSTGLYVQMVGRGFRLHPSKTNTLVLDFAGNVARHGPVDAIEVRDKSTAGGEGAVPTKVCPICQVDRSRRRASVHGVRLRISRNRRSRRRLRRRRTRRSSRRSPSRSRGTRSRRSSTTITSATIDAVAARRVLHGLSVVAREWICFEHTGYARDKAVSWWKRRSTTQSPTPSTKRCSRDELLKPTKIATIPDGRWTRIVEYDLDQLELPSALPHACWTCSYWSEKKKCCRKWEAEPPAEVQATGCDSWKEIRALECFDQMRERLREAQMPGYIREELQARLAWVEERPQILAINIDVAVIKRLVGDPS
jgi:DNA repair protein RadD